MLDSIGLGGFLANMFFWFFIAVALISGVIFYRLNKYVSLTLASILLNIAFLSYLNNVIVVQILLIFLWPTINLILLVYGVIRFLRTLLASKNKK
ncbi:MAG: hypothetical protein COZ27_00360 [Candidatus Moranbacteria bacterium CG_4_10_14_3_um_filter_41_65]|nr:MAG: hypothetical protein COZ86_04385 [Candidatus Moranbacteria bacterium CG_4_8_14_3_um_filter_41_13]PIX91898.1 MAG: hypothetical protein COZ27_00360 [Candidatus Moranbacteria bacterium CG_4_10_14_3_um_filter_41_65]PJC00340.1 MAG: hypothetical protein CO075_01150 [Candidatus Moranbacteria bacterium CG_4_9_14_0_8_um_filter_41_43]